MHVFTYVSTYFLSLPYDSWDLYFCYCCFFLLGLPLSVHLFLNQSKYISEIFWLVGSGRITWNLIPFWHEIYFFSREKFDVSKRFLAFFSPSYSMNKMPKLSLSLMLCKRTQNSWWSQIFQGHTTKWTHIKIKIIHFFTLFSKWRCEWQGCLLNRKLWMISLNLEMDMKKTIKISD